MARGEAAWAVTDSIKVLMDGPRTAQRPALTAVPCLRSCESRSAHHGPYGPLCDRECAVVRCPVRD